MHAVIPGNSKQQQKQLCVRKQLVPEDAGLSSSFAYVSSLSLVLLCAQELVPSVLSHLGVLAQQASETAAAILHQTGTVPSLQQHLGASWQIMPERGHAKPGVHSRLLILFEWHQWRASLGNDKSHWACSSPNASQHARQ